MLKDLLSYSEMKEFGEYQHFLLDNSRNNVKRHWFSFSRMREERMYQFAFRYKWKQLWQ
jgi:hypothetical protein